MNSLGHGVNKPEHQRTVTLPCGRKAIVRYHGKDGGRGKFGVVGANGAELTGLLDECQRQLQFAPV